MIARITQFRHYLNHPLPRFALIEMEDMGSNLDEDFSRGPFLKIGRFSQIDFSFYWIEIIKAWSFESGSCDKCEPSRYSERLFLLNVTHPIITNIDWTSFSTA